MAVFPEHWWAGRPLIIAHRGASSVAPENTLAAFREAVRMGADGVELDVHLSADGVPVVIHNINVDATTGGTGLVNKMSVAQLKELDAAAHFKSPHSDAAHQNAAFSGERIPTLEEVFAEVGQQTLINIELKDQGGRAEGLEAAVVEVVRRMEMQERVWFSSFKPYALVEARKHAPEIPCGLLYGPLNMGARLLAPVTPHEALHPYFPLVSEASVTRAHGRGLRVAVWTLDDEQVARQFADWGVDVIITNEPDKLLAALTPKP